MKKYQIWILLGLMLSVAVATTILADPDDDADPLDGKVQKKVERAELLVPKYYDRVGKRLTAILADEKQPIRQRVQAAKRLGQIKYPPAIPNLIRHIQLDDPGIQVISGNESEPTVGINSLAQYGPAFVPAVVDAYLDETDKLRGHSFLYVILGGKQEKVATTYFEKMVDLIEMAATLHDVGKIGIPDSILLKPGKLSEEEFEIMKKHAGFGKKVFETMSCDEMDNLRAHAAVGARMLFGSRSPLLQLAASIALTHHEKWNGMGYPLRLAGEDIPIEGRITAVADVFDALSSKRPYKEPFPLDKCFSIMEEERGKHFDPDVLGAFLKRRAEILIVQLRYAEVD